jgi:2-(1,2-epoxy-1,2-dihydrophenyl)acetyl-CoA isomerase
VGDDLRTLIVDEPLPAVRRIRLHRPDRLNAIDDEMCGELTAQLGAVRGHVRAVLLTGSGRAFCAGGDVKEFPRLFRPPAERARVAMDPFQGLARAVTMLDQPVLAAINGVAVGGGLTLAAACDLRIACESAELRLGFGARGLVPDLGGSFYLSRLIGFGRAMELALLNDPLSAADAASIGLVNRVVPDAELEDAALGLAERLAGLSPVGATWTKRCMHEALGSFEEALSRESFAQSLALTQPRAEERG